MADTVTANYALTKPEVGASDSNWGDKLNANMDEIDALIKAVNNALAVLASSGYTAADVLAKLLTVDGSGSGIDADKLDGLDASGFAAAAHTHTAYAEKAAGFAATRLFITVGGIDPTSQPGDVWISASDAVGPSNGFIKVRDAGNLLRRVVTG